MSIGILVTSDPGITNYVRQHLLLPASDGKSNEPTLWARSTDGSRGKANKWSCAGTLSQVLKSLSPTAREEKVIRIGAVAITPTNARDLLKTPYWSGTVAQRAIDAPDVGTQGYDDLEAALTDLVNRMCSGDDTLATMVEGTLHGAIGPVLNIDPGTADPTTVDAVIEIPPVNVAACKAAWVPDKSFDTGYVHRKINKVKDYDLFDFALAQQMNVLLAGPTGPGKTTAAIAYAASRQVPVAMISGTVALEPSQLFGKWIIAADGTMEWVDGLVTEIVRHGGVLVLDEVNFIPARIATVLFPLLAKTRIMTLLDHQSETIKAHPNLLIVATMNPGYKGTATLNQAFQNRFAVQIPWGYDPVVEKSLGIYAEVATLAKQLRDAHDKGEFTTPIPTNALQDLQRVAAKFGADFALANFAARFDQDEQGPLKVVIDTHRVDLRRVLHAEDEAQESGSPDLLQGNAILEQLIQAATTSV